MEIAILGTSNAIFQNGYIKPIKESFSINNLAVGASCSGAGIYNSIVHNCSDYKINILDFCVNDVNYLRYFLAEEHLIKYIEDLYKNIFDSNSKPIILVFPRKDLLNSYKKNPVYLLNKSLSNKYNILLIDGYKFIEHIRKSFPYIENTLYSDEAHLHPSIAQYLGQIIVEVAKSINSITDIKSKNNIKRSFYVLKADTFKKYKTLILGSSLRKEKVVIIEKGDILEIKEKTFLYGLMVDTGNSKCKIKITNGQGEEIIKNMYSSEMRDGKSQFKYIPLFKPMESKGIIRIEVVSNLTDDTEITHNSRKSNQEFGKLYLCGILLNQEPPKSKLIDFNFNHEKDSYAFQNVIEKYADKLILALNVSADILFPLKKVINTFPNDIPLHYRELSKISFGLSLINEANNTISIALKMRPKGPEIKKLSKHYTAVLRNNRHD